MKKFGIIQGRLSKSENDELQCFPKEWKAEFLDAKNLGIGFIELLSERDFNSSNPIWSNSGREQILFEAQKNNLEIYSSCTDYVIANSILNNETGKHVHLFIDASYKLGCKLVIFPLFGKSDFNYKNSQELIEILRYFGNYCAKKNITLGIESPRTTQELIFLIDKVNLQNVRCVFDTGNRAVFALDVADEIRELSELICHVHIKDKNHKDENVALGTGLINFKKIFDAFAEINYQGPFVFESVRGKNPYTTAEFNLNFSNYFFNESY